MKIDFQEVLNGYQTEKQALEGLQPSGADINFAKPSFPLSLFPKKQPREMPPADMPKFWKMPYEARRSFADQYKTRTGKELQMFDPQEAARIKAMPALQQKAFLDQFEQKYGQKHPVALQQNINFPNEGVREQSLGVMQQSDYARLSDIEKIQRLNEAQGIPTTVEKLKSLPPGDLQKMLARKEGYNVPMSETAEFTSTPKTVIESAIKQPGETAGVAFEGAKEKAQQLAEGAKGLYQGAKKEVHDWFTPSYVKQLQGYAKNIEQFYGNNIKPTIDKLSQSFGGMGAPIMAIGGMMLLSHLMGRRRRDDEEGGGRNININIGGGMTNPLAVPGVASLSSYKLGQEKQADVVTTALTNALKNRITNSVLDKVLIPSEHEKPQEQANKADEKTVEIVSKYPEMQELLKDEKNKQYLEKLLKE